MKVVKILPYSVYGEIGNAYEYVCNLLMHRVDPPSLKPSELDCRNAKVFCSPRKRALDCLNRSTASSVAVTDILDEIPFDIKPYCTPDEFKRGGSTVVRRAFIQAFVDNQLNLSRDEIQTQLEAVRKLALEHSDALAISHTFRMKLLMIYQEIGNELFRSPEVIQYHIDPHRHILQFGESIEFS